MKDLFNAILILTVLATLGFTGYYWNNQLMVECLKKGGTVIHDSSSDMETVEKLGSSRSKVKTKNREVKKMKEALCGRG